MKNDYEIRGDVTAILIPYKGMILETLIDTVDLPIVQSFEGIWRVSKVNWRPNKFYVNGAIYVKRNGLKRSHIKTISLARLLMNFPEGLVVDHINDDSLDNRRSCNLQAITSSENVKKQVRERKKGIKYRTVSRRSV